MSTPPLSDAQPGDRIVRGIVLALTATCCFVAMDSLAKYLGRTIPVPQLAWGRYGFHLLFLLALIPFLGWRRILYTRQPVAQLARGVFLFTATVSTYAAVQFLPLTTMYAIGFTAPLLVTALSVPMLREKVGLRRWLAVVVGLAGALVVVRPGFDTLNIGFAFAACMPLSFAFYQILTRRSARSDGALVGLFYAAVLGTIAASIAAPFFWTPLDLTGWAFMAVLGFVGATGHFLLILALFSAPASVISPMIYTQIVWATLIGYVVFHNLPDLWTVVGAAIVIGAGLFVFFRERALARRSRKERP